MNLSQHRIFSVTISCNPVICRRNYAIRHLLSSAVIFGNIHQESGVVNTFLTAGSCYTFLTAGSCYFLTENSRPSQPAVTNVSIYERQLYQLRRIQLHAR
ncbi:MAG: hypothetical protein LUG56_05435, partial [Lachnospiraceae bacterium]|nr:hypothetical protein [Lachnospiraceae bacterium]